MTSKWTDGIKSTKIDRQWQEGIMHAIQRYRTLDTKKILGMLDNLLMQIDYLYNNDRITDDQYADFIADWLDLYEEGMRRN